MATLFSGRIRAAILGVLLFGACGGSVPSPPYNICWVKNADGSFTIEVKPQDPDDPAASNLDIYEFDGSGDLVEESCDPGNSMTITLDPSTEVIDIWYTDPGGHLHRVGGLKPPDC